MKQLFASMLVLAMLLSMAACNTKVDPQPSGTEGGQQPENTVQTTDPEETTSNNNLEDWGVVDTFPAQIKNKDLQTIGFRWPAATGIWAATAKAATQGDGTLVLVDGYTPNISPEGATLETFFPLFFNQTVDAFARFYGNAYSNGTFAINSSKTSSINGYEVCKYTGIHTYEYSGVTYNDQYVAYVTTAKGNGAYIYWLVQDVSDDQSNGKLIEEHASNIIQSIWEIEE